MFGIETMEGPAKAAALVGLVLVEAAILYVGYGALFALLGDRLKAALGGA